MNLLFTGAWQQAAMYFDTVRQMGHDIQFLQQEKDELPCPAAWVEGVICNGLFLHHPIERFTNLRYIQLTSAGFDRVPIEYVKANGITIHNARGVYSVPMAEFAVAGVLSLYKELGVFREQQNQRRWEKKRYLRELAGQTVVIVGCGSVGTECAKRFSAFGCKVVGVDIATREDSAFCEIVTLSRLDEKLSEADVVILTLPLTVETLNLIDNRRLDLIHGVLVNIARGGVVDQIALTNWNGEAVLDVFEEEPMPEDSPLWENDRFVITPHNSFVGNGNNQRLSKLIIENLRKVENNEFDDAQR